MKPLIWIIDEEWPDHDYELATFSKQFPNCDIRLSQYDYGKDLETFGYQADVILTQVYTQLPKATIDRLQKCKGIAVYGGGYDRVDIKAAAEKGIMVTNVQGYCAKDIADYVMNTIYRFSKNLDGYSAQIKKGLWGAQAVPVPPHRIESLSLLVFGAGRIGSTVAEKAVRLGMHVMAYDPNVDADTIKRHGAQKVEREYGLKHADFISVHVNLCEKTQNLITQKDFLMMKPTAFLINTSRGAIINEADMIEAVGNHVIAGAMLDVIQKEPPLGSEKVLGCKNITVTPHISYISYESFAELKKRTVQNAILMLSGEKPVDLVNGAML